MNAAQETTVKEAEKVLASTQFEEKKKGDLTEIDKIMTEEFEKTRLLCVLLNEFAKDPIEKQKEFLTDNSDLFADTTNSVLEHIILLEQTWKWVVYYTRKGLWRTM
ncbi:MAG TPA: hypothetical protein ENH82_07585 [bacterium]|nr:hypothetical protein [bacterium]